MVLDGVPDKRIIEALRSGEWGLTLAQARKLLKDAHKAVVSQQPRPIEWHRANQMRLMQASLENANFRVALEANKELARLDGVHNINGLGDIQLDGSAESARAAVVAVTLGVLKGSISNNTAQALLPLLKSLMAEADDGDEQEDLSRRDVSEEAPRSAAARILRRLGGG
jgi:hypothetical protein